MRNFILLTLGILLLWSCDKEVKRRGTGLTTLPNLKEIQFVSTNRKVVYDYSENDKLEKATYYESDGEVDFTIEYEYLGNTLSRIVYPNFGYSLELTQYSDSIVVFAKDLMSGNIDENYKFVVAISGMQAEYLTYYNYSSGGYKPYTQVEFIWQNGNNITELVSEGDYFKSGFSLFKATDRHISKLSFQFSDPKTFKQATGTPFELTETITRTFDSYHNPFYAKHNYYKFESKNNMLEKVKNYTHSSSVQTTIVNIEYNEQNLPTKKIIVSGDEYDSFTSEEIYIYEES